MAKSNKEFERDLCFTFYGSYRETAREIEADFGLEVVAKFYNAIMDYALYEKEPELEGVLKYVWHTTKTTIDASVQRRSRGFNGEDVEMTERIMKYMEENPDATERQIAEDCGCSKGKVGKVKKQLATNNSNNNLNNNSNLNSNNNSNGRGHGQERGQASHTQTDREETERRLEDLSFREKEEIVAHYKKQDMKYPQMYKHYNLISGCLSKGVIEELETEINRQKREAESQRVEEINNDALSYFNLTKEEGNELCSYISEYGLSWDEYGEVITEIINGYVDSANMSAKELLTYLRDNEYARVDVFKKGGENDIRQRFIIDKDKYGDKYRWEDYGEYLASYVANPSDVKAKVTEYFNNKGE